MGRDVSRDKGGDQAAWRDLVARLELPSTVDPADVPWPDRENLRSALPAPQAQAPADGDQPADADKPADADQPANTDQSATGSPAVIPPPPSRVIRPASPARASESDSQPSWRGPSVPSQASGQQADDDQPTSPDIVSFLEYLDEDYQDPNDPANRYVPPPVPPQPKLDPVAKGAWTALFGGPAYLLVATMLGWQVPGWAELAAIAAFVTGFVVLVSRLGDGPSRRDGPDQGAVL